MTNERLAEKTLAILQSKSEKALKMAKELILKEKFRYERAKEALKYYLSTWNDTTRPGVLSLAYEAVRGKPEEVVPLQTAMLFIDAAMDIHDDIIDKSTLKRSRETLYGKFGEEAALLIGNALLVKGFNYLYNVAEKLPPDKKQLIIDAVKGFLFKVIDAHIYELELKRVKWSVEPKEYFRVLEAKAADIEGHMRIGAIFAGGTDKEIKALSRYGKYLGTLLMVREDFVDTYEPDELMNRVKHECLPLPVIFTLQNETYRKEVSKILSKEGIDESDTTNLIEIIYKTPEISQLKRRLNALKRKALAELIYLRQTETVNQLKLITLSTLEDL
jgi:geranylgeranyl pyrophosphate synthase